MSSRQTESLTIGHDSQKSAKGYLLAKGNWNKKRESGVRDFFEIFVFVLWYNDFAVVPD